MEPWNEKELQEVIALAQKAWKLTTPFPLSFPPPLEESGDLFPPPEKIESLRYRNWKLCRACNKPKGKTPEDFAEMSRHISFYYCKGHLSG
jgi:hypothetical protein